MKKASYKYMKNKQRPIEINLMGNGRGTLNFESDCDELKDIMYVDDIGNLTFEEWLCPTTCKLEDLKDFYFYKVIEKLGPSDIWSKKIREEKSIYMQLVNYAISFLFEGVSINEILRNLLSISSSNNVYIEKLNKMGYVATLTLIQLEVTKRLLNDLSNSDNYMSTVADSKEYLIYKCIQMLSLLYLKQAKKCIKVLKNNQLYYSNIMLEEEDVTLLFKNKDFNQYFLCLMEKKVTFVSSILQEIGIKSLIDSLEKYGEGVYPFSDKEYENMKYNVDAQPNYEYLLSESKNKKVVDLFSNVRVFDEFDKIDTSSKNLKAWEKLAAGSSQLLQYYADSNYEYKSEGCIEDLFSKMLRKYKDTYLISNYSEVFNDMDLAKVLSYLIISRNDIEMKLMTQMGEDTDSNYVSKMTTKNLYLSLHVLIIDIAPDIIDTLPLMEWARKNDRKLYEDLLKNPCVNRNFSIAVKYNKKLSEAKSAGVVAFPYLQKSIVSDHAIPDSLMERLSGYNIMYSVDCSIKSFLFKEMLCQIEDWLDIRVNAYNLGMEKISRYCRNMADKLENYGETDKSDEQKIIEDITDTVVGYYIEEKKKEAEAKKAIKRAIELEEQRILQKIQVQIGEYGSVRELIELLKEDKVHPKSKIKSAEDILLTPIEISSIKDEDRCIISFDTALDLVQNVFYGVCSGKAESPSGSNTVEELMQLLCMFYFKFEEDEIDFPLAILINLCRNTLSDNKSGLRKVLHAMDEYKKLSEYIDEVTFMYNNGYKLSKKKIKSAEDVNKFLCDEISALKYQICNYGRSFSARYSLSPEVAEEMYNSDFEKNMEIDLNSKESFLIGFPDFGIQTTLDGNRFECKITVNSKNRYVDLFTVKCGKNIHDLLNSDLCISNHSLLGLLSYTNNDVIAWGKNGTLVGKGEVVLDKLVNPGIIGSKLYNKFPKEAENYVRKIQAWTGESLTTNFVVAFLAEGVEKHREYFKKFAYSMINMHLNAMYYKQSGFLNEEDLGDGKLKELVLAPEYHKLKKISNKKFDSNKIDLESFKYAPILKVPKNTEEILKFQVFLLKLGVYGSEYIKLPERFYTEEGQKYLEEVYRMLIEKDSEDVIVDEYVKNFLFDEVKFKFPFLDDKLKFTESIKVDPDNLKCSYMEKLGESLVLYDCEWSDGKLTINDEAYLDYIDSFYFYFTKNGRLNEYNIYSPVVEDMSKINEETKKFADSMREAQAVMVYSYVLYVILILERNRIMQMAENTRNRKFVGKIIQKDMEDGLNVDESEIDETSNKSDGNVQSEDTKQSVTIRKNSLNEEENSFLDTLSPEEFRLLEEISEVNGVKVVNLGNLFFKKMNRLMQGIRSLERVAPRYKVKSWAVRGYTRTSKNGVISYIEGGVRRRNTELLDKDAIERQEKILSLDDILKSSNIFEDK